MRQIPKRTACEKCAAIPIRERTRPQKFRGRNDINDFEAMKPDYPHKVFNDKRIGYFLLMEALAMDAARY